MSVVVVDDDKPFVASEWIGCGKVYSQDTPWEVIQAKNAAFELSAETIDFLAIPAPHLSVLDFAKQVLPRQSSELAYQESLLWFSKEEPTKNFGVLRDRTRTIPPRAVLNLLERKAPQLWLDGYRSISDPRYNEGTDRLPLWVLTFWKTMASLCEHQANWKRGLDWLNNEYRENKEEDTRVAIDSARTALKTLGWNAPLAFGNQTMSTLCLQKFLGAVWLNSDCVDIMMEDLAARVESDTACTDVIVATLAFARDIAGLSKGRKPLPDRYAAQVNSGEKKRIVFPVNVGNCHWIGGMIDFSKGIIAFGDSLHGLFEPPKKLVKSLNKWALSRIGVELHAEYNGLQHGVQQDSFSCGVVMANTCEHAIYPDEPLWIPRDAVRSRLTHFLKYAKNQHKEYSVDASMSGASRVKISIASLLNPMKNPSTDSAVSSASGESWGSDFSDADVLLGRATWGDNSEGAQSEEEQTTDAQMDDASEMSLGVSSGRSGEWDTASSSAGHGSAMEIDPAVFEEGDSVMQWESAVPSPSSAAEQVLQSRPTDIERDNASDSSRGGGKINRMKGSVQSSLMSFFGGKGKRKEDAPTTAGLKRQRSEASASSAASVPTEKKPKKAKKPRAPTPPNVGLSRAATWARETNEKIKNGTFVPDPTSDAEWREKILDIDPSAEFLGPRSVRHSTCANPVTLKTAYDTTRFKEHIKRNCPRMKKGAGMSTLKTIFNLKASSSSQPTSRASRSVPNPDEPDKPCPGITEADIPRVEKYLRRTGASGGGSRSVFKIAQEKFKKAFSSLGKTRRKEVLDQQMHEQTWRNDHSNLRVFSISCLKTVPAHRPRTLPCSECAKLLRRKDFKTALKKRTKDAKNYIYINKQYINQILGEIYGRTQGLQEIIEQPLAAEHLASLGYDGPVNLSCDDTKLFASFRLYWDGEKKSHFLVGGDSDDGPLQVSDPEQVKAVIREAKAKKATKIRLWCLTIPVPGITPLVVAALPISNDLKADALLGYLNQVVNGLIDHNINIISYACDGTQTERNVQDMFVDQAAEKIEHVIQGPGGDFPPIRIKIAVVRNHLIAMIQDSKHGLKTFRNNLFAGARLLTLEASKPLGRGTATPPTINFDFLVELRRKHQTLQAARGVRTRNVDANTEKSKELSLRQQLVRQFHLALKEDQGRGVGTGVERSARWKASAPGGRGENTSSAAGNTANAAETATALAKKAAIKRKEVFRKANVPAIAEIIAARVTLVRPFRVGDFGIVWTKKGLMVGHVFAMYAKGGGKNGKHEAITDSSNISALSKVSVQIFDNLHASLQTKQFAHIPPTHFLCLLSHVPKFTPTGIDLVQADAELFKTLSRGRAQFDNAMVLFAKRGKRTQAGDEYDEFGEDLE
ncbi:hypothetical protein R3P38DRAFT_3376544 [Favolaschia claudopus]|uniref:Ubiquitin-like protease family profile domain-containing protein n=1 Tax=Favolaschia claudopus TaxID=2862362 RepID=A0AAV9ZF46_9AGAR